MSVGEYSGERVQEAKSKIQLRMVEKGEAVLYQEPERTVISRSGDECVVALCDQWWASLSYASWCDSGNNYTHTHACSKYSVSLQLCKEVSFIHARTHWVHTHRHIHMHILPPWIPNTHVLLCTSLGSWIMVNPPGRQRCLRCWKVWKRMLYNIASLLCEYVLPPPSLSWFHELFFFFYCHHLLGTLHRYSEEVRNNFHMTVDWLHEHACSRSYGLGKHNIMVTNFLLY